MRDRVDDGLGHALPAGLSEELAAVWPGVALVERIALASPILRVLACRRGNEAAFEPALAARRDCRRQQIADAAHALIAMEPDYRAMAASLQEEVNRRDRLLDAARVRFEFSLEGRLRRAFDRIGRLVGRIGR